MIIDVRTKDEFLINSCVNSINIPLAEINANIEIIKTFEDIIFVCEGGKRSARAEMFCKNLGINCKNGGSYKEYL